MGIEGLTSYVKKSQKPLALWCILKPQIKLRKQEDLNMTYVCDACRWEYNEVEGYPEGGIAPGTKWEDVPEDFQCPLCLAGKDLFVEG